MFKIKKWFWNGIHNCIAHPLMFLSFQSNLSVKFHDFTAVKMD